MRFGHALPRSFVSLASAALLVAAAPPPPALAPYVQAGSFEPGDYGWMRGRFKDASLSEKASFKAVQDWLTRCMADEQARVRGELATAGVPNSPLPPGSHQDTICGDVASAIPAYEGWPSFSALQADRRTAEPVAGAFLWATDLASDIGGPRGKGLTEALIARPLGEQMLRFGVFWGDGATASRAPKLSPGVRAIVTARISMAIGRSDRANTKYLKDIVDRQGWPKISVVGEKAANAAWLIVQHADNDPLFQLRALRLMEPLVAISEVSKQNFAYLYDRVMLKAVGTQRYATQMTCKAGNRVPLPLEDANAVDRLRAEAGLSTLAEYEQQMAKLFGTCPPS